MNYTPEAKAAITRYLETAHWVQQSGAELEMATFLYPGLFDRDLPLQPGCGTTCCMAGWRAFMDAPRARPTQLLDDADKVARKLAAAIASGEAKMFGMIVTRGYLKYVGGEDVPLPVRRQFDVVWELLFGPDNGRGRLALAKQTRRAYWILNRIEQYDLYMEEQALPRRERRLRQIERQRERQAA